MRSRIVLVAALVALTAGCGSGPQEQQPAAPAAGGAFPVTVEHSLGETTVPAEPQRVVALGATDADVALALGVLPVGIRSPYDFENGVGAWAEDELAALRAEGGAAPEVWGRELNVEAVAAADPDLILYVQDGGEQTVFDQLSGIAPTVGLPVGADPYGASWQDSTRLIAAALGRAEAGEQVVGDTEARLADTAAQNPGFAGRTMTYLDVFGADVYFGGPNSAAVETMGALGFTSPAFVQDFPDGQTQNPISAELLSEVDADVVLAYTFDRTVDQVRAEVPAIEQLTALREDRFGVLDDLSLSQPTVLSIPHALEGLLPFLVTATGG